MDNFISSSVIVFAIGLKFYQSSDNVKKKVVTWKKPLFK